MTYMQYAGDFYAKSCQVAEVYDEFTLNNIFIKDFDSSIFRSH